MADRVLRASVHIPQPDGDYVTVLGGTPEADARKQAGDAADEWGEHVWEDADQSGQNHHVLAQPSDRQQSARQGQQQEASQQSQQSAKGNGK
jgi:hypothetical protein